MSSAEELIMIAMIFISGIEIILFALLIFTCYKDRQPKNNVHFYVAKDKTGILSLWFGKPYRGTIYWVAGGIKILLAVNARDFNLYGLHIEDYNNLKWEDEPVEVFLNLKD